MAGNSKKPPLNLPAASYEVGYGKPPAEHRYKPGQSGNPLGRPKGARNKQRKPYDERLKEIVLEEAYREVQVHDGNKQVTVPMAQAIVRSMAVSAAKGNTRAQRLFSEMLANTEASYRKLQDDWLQTAIEYKTSWEHAIETARARGLPSPDPVPHPDDIIIDMNTGEVVIKGPMTPEERKNREWILERRDAFLKELDDLKADLEDPRMQPCAEQIREHIRHTKTMLGLADKFLNSERRF